MSEKGKDDRPIKISKWHILQKSGCLRQLILTSLMCSASSFSAFVHSYFVKSSLLADVVSLAFAIVAACFAVVMLGHLLMAMMIVREKYKLVVSKVLGVSYKNKYSDKTTISEKKLEFDDFKLSVSSVKASEFEIGDEAVVVFVNGIKYPIIVESVKIFKN